MEKIDFQIIGVIHSCFKEKFGIPRQSGLAPSADAELELLGDFSSPQIVEGLDEFSHIWICFVFHKNLDHEWRPQVRPPRLGGNQYLGVFATRSGVRPNPIGWSVVRYHGYRESNNKIFLRISGVDIVDGTPVLDIKPYLPYADSIMNAQAGYATDKPETVFTVEFSQQALQFLATVSTDFSNLKQIIIETLSQDPRPAYYKHRATKSNFGTRIYHFEISWEIEEPIARVTKIEFSDICA